MFRQLILKEADRVCAIQEWDEDERGEILVTIVAPLPSGEGHGFGL